MTKWEEFLLGGIADTEGNRTVCEAILADVPVIQTRQKRYA